MFAITGGGTGGHLAIAKALAVELQAQNLKAIYIGSTLGQDKAWFENSELFTQCYFLESSGVVNKSGLNKLKAIFKQFQATLEAKKILKAHKVTHVISVGGFSAGGASMGAILARIPLFIHEQNAIKGKLNEILTPFAKAVFGSFHSNSKNFISTSYPVRDEFFATSRIRKECKNILFLGGSQGAKGINDFALKLTPLLLQKGINVAHQCGERDFERIKQEYENLGILNKVDSGNFHNENEVNLSSISAEVSLGNFQGCEALSAETSQKGCQTSEKQNSLKIAKETMQFDLFAFDKNLVTRLQKADLCIARCGASSLWEMVANGLIGIFVPYPYAAKDHQYFNAKSFTDEGLGFVIRENELDTKSVLGFIESLQGESLEQKSSEVITKIKPNGAREILTHINALTPISQG